jgi:primase-polymerase (primpol)-like protein
VTDGDAERLRRVVPACLRARDQWVCWKRVKRNGKWTKPPFEARTGDPADATKPNTWASFEETIAACGANPQYAGIGYVFAPDDPYCGVDLDDCTETEAGPLHPWAQRMVDLLAVIRSTAPR